VPGDDLVESCAVVHDDGRLCVLRIALRDDRLLDAETIVLHAGSEAEPQRLLPVDASPPEDGADGSVEFLVPWPLLEGPQLGLQVDEQTLPLPLPERRAEPAGQPSAIAAAYLSHHAQLHDLHRRLGDLREELRRQRRRTVRAEAELDGLHARLGQADPEGAVERDPDPDPDEPRIADLGQVEVVGSAGEPLIDSGSLPLFSVDALAELYATALEAVRARERLGSRSAGERWRQLSRSITDEAATRLDELRTAGGAPARGASPAERRRMRLRAQLRTAAESR
jgi:hypothetical protein